MFEFYTAVGSHLELKLLDSSNKKNQIDLSIYIYIYYGAVDVYIL